MTAVTMRADQVRKGDKITVTLDVSESFSSVNRRYLRDGDERSLIVPEDSEVTVERPDPDAELIEVMAKGAYQGWPDLPLDWDDLDENQKDDERCAQRAALAAAREAGLLPEVTP